VWSARGCSSASLGERPARARQVQRRPPPSSHPQHTPCRRTPRAEQAIVKRSPHPAGNAAARIATPRRGGLHHRVPSPPPPTAEMHMSPQRAARRRRNPIPPPPTSAACGHAGGAATEHPAAWRPPPPHPPLTPPTPESYEPEILSGTIRHSTKSAHTTAFSVHIDGQK